MKKIVILSLMLLSVGCNPIQDNTVSSQKSRFIRIEDTASFCVYYDKYTRVMYVCSAGGYNNGNFTMLVNSDGSPLLYEE